MLNESSDDPRGASGPSDSPELSAPTDSPERAAVRHPAKFNAEIIATITDSLIAWTDPDDDPPTALDPFGGLGGVHDLPTLTYAIEIEPEWAGQSAERGWTWCGDFFDFDPTTSLFNLGGNAGIEDLGPRLYDAIVTSPTYGNRMADKHVPGPNDKSKRLTYRHTLGRDLTDNNSGGMQWGREYRVFHMVAWQKVWQLLAPGGLFLLNVKDHVRKSELISASKWHKEWCEQLGFTLLDDIHIPVRGMGFGQNQTLNEGLKVDYEHLYVFRKEA